MDSIILSILYFVLYYGYCVLWRENYNSWDILICFVKSGIFHKVLKFLGGKVKTGYEGIKPTWSAEEVLKKQDEVRSESVSQRRDGKGRSGNSKPAPLDLKQKATEFAEKNTKAVKDFISKFKMMQAKLDNFVRCFGVTSTYASTLQLMLRTVQGMFCYRCGKLSEITKHDCSSDLISYMNHEYRQLVNLRKIAKFVDWQMQALEETIFCKNAAKKSYQLERILQECLDALQILLEPYVLEASAREGPAGIRQDHQPTKGRLPAPPEIAVHFS